jgi:hypothetical protein
MVTRLTINIAEPLRRKAKSIAALRGETMSDVVRDALEGYVSAARETPAARAGTPIQRLEDWQADFWPADEPVDELVATVREWRHQDAKY